MYYITGQKKASSNSSYCFHPLISLHQYFLIIVVILVTTNINAYFPTGYNVYYTDKKKKKKNWLQVNITNTQN